MTPDDWALLKACAVEVLAAARPWWAAADEHDRARLASPLMLLSEAMDCQHARGDPTPRPARRDSQEELMWACYQAAEAIRVNVSPYDERGQVLWEAGARLAYVATGIKAALSSRR